MAILDADRDAFVVWFGVLCSSWSITSRGTSLRSYLDPLGNDTLPFVREGNVMVTRTPVPICMLYNILHACSPAHQTCEMLLRTGGLVC